MGKEGPYPPSLEKLSKIKHYWYFDLLIQGTVSVKSSRPVVECLGKKLLLSIFEGTALKTQINMTDTCINKAELCEKGVRDSERINNFINE